MSTDHYATLGVSRTATIEEIKIAYKQKARECHPDRIGGSTAEFQKIQQAHETLSDPTKKAQYDNPMPQFAGGFPFPGFPGGFPFPGFPGFPGHVQQQQRQPKIIPLKVTLKDVYYGSKKKLHIARACRCQDCTRICDRCKGAKVVQIATQMGPFTQISNTPCTTCQGRGTTTSQDNCTKCAKSRTIHEQNDVEIDIPKGAQDGTTIQIDNWGEQDPNGNFGPLQYKIEVTADSNFTRQGNDLLYKTGLSYIDALCGKTVQIPLFDSAFPLDTRTLGVLDPTKEYTIPEKGINGGALRVKFTVRYPSDPLPVEICKKLREILG